jgi:hypothetical protein
MDKLLISYGEHLLGSLFWALSVPQEKVPRGRWWYFLVSWAYIDILAIPTFFLYFLNPPLIHSMFILIHISVIHVAVHEGNKSLLALLLLVQFAEMKGSALKTTNKAKLYHMCLEGLSSFFFLLIFSDVVERFQLLVYVLWILLYSISTSEYNFLSTDFKFKLIGKFIDEYDDFLFSILVVYLSELCVDW